jgi:hypothetical protein
MDQAVAPAACGEFGWHYGTAYKCVLPKGHAGLHSMFTYEMVPRRARIDSMTPAELALYEAVKAVDAIPFQDGRDHTKLTHALTLLGKARDIVADFIDDVEMRVEDRRGDVVLELQAQTRVVNGTCTVKAFFATEDSRTRFLEHMAAFGFRIGDSVLAE